MAKNIQIFMTPDLIIAGSTPVGKKVFASANVPKLTAS